jgi:hypothetical protein
LFLLPDFPLHGSFFKMPETKTFDLFARHDEADMPLLQS